MPSKIFSRGLILLHNYSYIINITYLNNNGSLALTVIHPLRKMSVKIPSRTHLWSLHHIDYLGTKCWVANLTIWLFRPNIFFFILGDKTKKKKTSKWIFISKQISWCMFTLYTNRELYNCYTTYTLL